MLTRGTQPRIWFPAAKAALDFLAQHHRLRRIGGSDHAFGLGGQFPARELPLRIQVADKPDDLSLFFSRQGLDLVCDLVRGQGANLRWCYSPGQTSLRGTFSSRFRLAVAKRCPLAFGLFTITARYD